MNGTGLKGYVTTTFDALVAKFGDPTRFTGSKNTVLWMVDFDGKIATIYDYKVVGTPFPLQPYAWHIGGHEFEVVALVKAALGVV